MRSGIQPETPVRRHQAHSWQRGQGVLNAITTFQAAASALSQIKAPVYWLDRYNELTARFFRFARRRPGQASDVGFRSLLVEARRNRQGGQAVSGAPD